MKGVRRVRRDQGIALRRIQSLLSQHWIIVGMDDVMRETRMFRLLQQDRFEDLGRLLLIRVGLVAVGSIRDQR